MEPGKKEDASQRIRRTKGGLNAKLHAVGDGDGEPLISCFTGGQVSNYDGAKHVFGHLPPDATALIAVRRSDADWRRDALRNRDITPSIPRPVQSASSPSPKTPISTSAATSLSGRLAA